MAAGVARTRSLNLEIVRRCKRYKFIMRPKRWIVERTINWIGRNRRIAATIVRMAMTRDMLRRLAAKPSAWARASRKRIYGCADQIASA